MHKWVFKVLQSALNKPNVIKYGSFGSLHTVLQYLDDVTSDVTAYDRCVLTFLISGS